MQVGEACRFSQSNAGGRGDGHVRPADGSAWRLAAYYAVSGWSERLSDASLFLSRTLRGARQHVLCETDGLGP